MDNEKNKINVYKLFIFAYNFVKIRGLHATL